MTTGLFHTSKIKKSSNIPFIYLCLSVSLCLSNCGTPTEKASDFLDFYLKCRMFWSYIRDSGDFIDKMKRIGKIPEGSFLVTADVVGLYPSIPHNEGISALKQKLEEQPSTKIVAM